MKKKEAIADFLRSFDLSFKQASLYFKEHPSFLESVGKVRQKLDTVFTFVSPLKIHFTQNSLFIEEEYWEKERVYTELAKAFHHRMVKSIEVRQGISTEELATLIIKTNLPPKDILKRGGLKLILDREKVTNLSIEDLDYSQLLKGEGNEIQDVWEFFLEEALELADTQRIKEVSNSFDKVITSYKTEEFLEKEDLLENINKLFLHLKRKDKRSFRKCAKSLMKTLMKNREILEEDKLDKIKTLFKGLSDEDFASTLWEELSTDKHFDSLSFNIFVKLTEKPEEKEIAKSLQGLIKKEDITDLTPEMGERLKELLTKAPTSVVPEIYRKTLSNLFKDITFEERIVINRDLLQKSYLYLLLELLQIEDSEVKIQPILEKISEEWVKKETPQKLELSIILFKTLFDRRKKIGHLPIFKKMRKDLSYSMETSILSGEITQDFKDQLEHLDGTSFKADDYLHKILIERKIHPYILQLFFKFFPDSLELFIEIIRKSKSDKALLENLIDSLKQIEQHPSLTIYTLETIYSLGDNLLKSKVLKAMQELPKYDEDFLLSVLKKEDHSLKIEAVVILKRDKLSRNKALKVLLTIPSLFGFKNRILIENINLVEEMDLKEASDYLVALSKRKAFWYKNLKEASLRILGKWNERKN